MPAHHATPPAPASAPHAPSPAVLRRRAARQRALARRRPRLSRLLCWLLSALLGSAAFAPAQAQPAPGALPSGGQVVVGSGQLQLSPNLLVVQQNSARLGLDWQSFNIGSGATVEFRQPGASSVALNRVLGNSGSEIYGQLKANGQVFLSNPNGVLFAPGAQVDVGGMVASTLDLSQQDFAAGRYNFSATASGGSVVNQGSLRASAGGYLALFGNQVSNSGSIAVDAGSVVLASGRAATVSISGSGLISAVVTPGAQGSVLNSGSIAADGGTVTLSARSAQDIAASLVNNTGIVRANTLVEKAGEIWITGDNVSNSGTISVAAPAGGNAGRISVLGDMNGGAVQVGGTLDASAKAGLGGFVETSAATVKVADGAQITTAAPQGGSGTWLIDPKDFTIAPSGGDTTGAAVSSNLATNGNVLIQSSAGAGGTAGNVNVNDIISWTQNKLTLSAYGNVNINAALTGTGTATLALEFGQGAVNAGNAATDLVKAPVTLPAGASLTTKLGSDGAVTNYTVVTTLAGLQAIDGNAAALAANYALGADITGSGSFNPIGNEATAYNSGSSSTQAYSGRFDGLGHTLSGIVVNPATSFQSGLFAVTKNATVANLTLDATSSVTGGRYAGGVVGYADGSTTLSNVKSGAAVAAVDASSGGVYAGGVAGYFAGAAGSLGIANSSATGNVSGDTNTSTAYVGGLVGLQAGAALGSVSATGTVSATVRANGSTGNFYVGGLVGAYNGSGISSATAGGSVSSAGGTVGGLAGSVAGNGGVNGSTAAGAVTDSAVTGNVGGLIGAVNGTISIGNSSASGNVTGGNETGGLIGYYSGGTGSISNVSASGNVSSTGNNDVAGLIGYATGSGSLSNASATGNVTAAANADSVGGLVGEFRLGGGLSNGSASGTVSGGNYTGGVVGYYTSPVDLVTNAGSNLAITYTGASVSGGSYVGGIVGQSVGTAALTGLSVAANVTGTGNVGGLAGYTVGNVTGSSASGTVSGTGNVGGLVGYVNGSSTVLNSSASGAVSNTTTNGYVGGLVGYANGASIDTGNAMGAVSGGSETGGLVGYFNGGTKLTNSTATGNVTATGDVGGLVGYATGGGVLSNSKATGTIAAGSNYAAGGLAGNLQLTGGIVNSEADGNVSGGSNTGGLVGYYSSATALVTDAASGKAITVKASTVTGGSWVGGVVGYSNGTSAITGVSVASTVTATGNAGGLAGYTGGNVTGSSASGAVSGAGYVGGLVGQTAGNTAVVGTSLAGGSVSNSSTNGSTGGLIGYASHGGGISGSEADGLVSGGGYVGGLVGYYGGNGDITTSQVKSASVSGGGYVGGLVGYSSGTAGITGISVAVDVTATGTAGGLAGRTGGNVTGSSASGKVSGKNNVGGLIGEAAGSGTVLNSSASGSVGNSTNSGYVGGLVGYASGTSIDTGVASGAVSGGSETGGLVGYFNSGVKLTNSLATGAVTSAGDAGGLVGYATGSGVLSNSKATGTVTATNYSYSVGGLAGDFRLAGGIVNSEADGSVSGGSNTGGLVGYYSSATALVTDASSGQAITVKGSTVSGGSWAGGVVGYSAGASAITGVSVATTVSATGSAGGLAGYIAGNVTGSSASGTVTGGSSVGGLIAQAGGSVTGSTASGAVTGNATSGYVGGLVGYATGGSITTSSATGSVSGGSETGGLVGYFNSNGNITFSTARGNVNAAGDAGGLVGYAVGSGKVSDSLATGNVTTTTASGSNYAGGLAGDFRLGGGIVNSESDGNVSGGYWSGGLVGYYLSNADLVTDASSGKAITVKAGSVSGINYAGGVVGYMGGTAGIVGIAASANVSSGAAAGGLAGYTNGTVSNSSASGTVSGGNSYVGGLIGLAGGTGTLSNLSASGSVTGGANSYAGGLIGQAAGSATLTDVSATGSVTAGSSSYTGGLVGYQSSGGLLRATASGTVAGGSSVGGLVGYYTSNGDIANASASGSASGASTVGGLIGSSNGSGQLRDSAATGIVTGTTTSGSVGGLVGSFSQYGGMLRVSAAGAVSGGSSTGGLAGTFTPNGGTLDTGTYTGATVSGSNQVGGLVGYAYYGNVANSSTAAKVGGGTYDGGLIGYAYGVGTVSNSSASGAVGGTSYVGGLTGWSDGYGYTGASASGNVTATGNYVNVGGLIGRVGYNYTSQFIQGSQASGTVVADAPNAYVGGLVGLNYYGSISGSTATGNVTGLDSSNANGGSHYTGGLVGYFYGNSGSNNPVISNSTASGTVSGRYYAGGLVAYFYYGGISGSSASGAVSGTNTVGGLVGYAYATSALSNVSASGNVTAGANASAVGGLVGSLTGAGITGGFASGKVTAGANSGNVGGLVGTALPTLNAAAGAAINDSGATGDVSGGSSTGGLVGNYSTGSGGYYGGIVNSRASGQVSGSTYAGGLVGQYYSGYASSPDINNSYATGAVSGTQYVGGLAGNFNGITGIGASYATGAVTGLGINATTYLGGLVGYYNRYSAASGNALAQSYATGSVSQTAAVALSTNTNVYAGGLVGYLNSGSGNSLASVALSDAYASGSVTLSNARGQLRAGGLVGYANASIARTYATGAVTVTGGSALFAGGLVAQRNNGASLTVADSFWDLTATGQASSAGGSGLTPAQMQQASSFANWSLASAGGGGTTWRIYQGYTDPLLSTFLTPLTLTLADASKTYDGTTSFGNAQIAGASGPIAYPSRIFTAALSPDVGSYAVNAAGIYSVQNGYDLTVTGSATLTVTPRPLTLAGVIANKVYDGTTTATVIGNAQPTGLVAGEDLSVDIGNVTATFDTKNVGTNKTVTVTGYTLGDGVHGKASNYSLSAGTNTTASITPAPLTAGGFAATDRAYDGTTVVAVTATANSSVTGIIGNDQVAVDLSGVGSGTVASKNVGTAKPVTVSGVALTGADAGNYQVVGINGVTVNITPKTVVVNSLTAPDQTYNASTSVQVGTASGVISGLVAGDLVTVQNTTLTGTMADKNVGSNKPVSVSGVVLLGPDAANYAAAAGPVSVNITPATVYMYVSRIGGASGTDKVYDGTTAANATVSLSGKYSGDNLLLSYNAPTYSDKNVAYDASGNPTTKTISVTGAQISGTDAANYTLNTTYYGASTYGTISPKPVPVSGIAAVNRVYDGTTTVSVNVANASVDTSGLVAGDIVSVNVPSGTNGTVAGTMVDRNVGTGKAVSVPGLTLSGADAGNYTFAGTNGVTVNITPKPVTATYTGIDKVYDGSTYAQVSASSTDLLAVDLANNGVYFYSNLYGGYYGYYGYATFTGSGAKNVGSNKPVTVNYDALYGTYAGNYTLVGVGTGTTTASITPKPLASLAYTGVNKVYDGTTSASVTLNAYASGIVGGDAVTSTQSASFTGATGKNVNNGTTITVSNVALAGADAGNYTLASTTSTTSANITPKPVTFSGIAGVDRVYDGTTAVAVNASAVTSTGFVAGDNVAVAQPGGGLTAGTVADKNVGTNKVVTVTGLTLTGSDAANYSIDAAGSGITVNITPRPLTATYTGVDRAYNGGITAQVAGSSADIIAGDNISFTQSAIFTGLNGRNVGSNKPVSVTNIALGGADQANYSLVNTTAGTTASITAKPVNISWSGVTRVYDGVGDLAAQVLPSSPDWVAGDVVTLTQTAVYSVDGAAGTGKAIAISNIALAGPAAANYALTATTATTTGTISPRPIGVTGIVAQNRVYDGTTAVALNVANAAIDASAVIAGDSISVTLPPNGISSGTMLTRDVGTGKDVQVTGLGISGSSAANYTLVGATGLTVNITPRSLSASYAAAGKVYDGLTAATITATSSDILAIDTGAVGISATGVFGDKNVGSGKTVAVSGGFLTGAARNNYALVNTTASVTAGITPKLIAPSYVGLSKVYDGTTSALVSAQTAGIVANDVVGFMQTAAFTDAGGKNVGSGKAITVSNITLTGADAANYQLTASTASTSGGITPRPITVAGLAGVTVTDRVYDGTTTVVVNIPSGVTLTPNSADIIAGDQVSIGVPAAGQTTGTMANKNAGNGKAVAVTGLTLSGADAANYQVAGSAGITVNITQKPVTAAYSGVTRSYDGTTSVAVVGSSADILAGDVVSIGGSGVFTGAGAKNAGSGKAIGDVNATLSGSDAANYALINGTGGSATGIVLPKLITPGYTGGSRVYDGTTAASVTATGAGIVGGDVVTFSQTATYADKNAGTGKTISVSGITLSGSDATNYALLVNAVSTTGTISPRPITLVGLTGVTAVDRVYDGSTTVAVNVTASGPVAPAPGDIIAGDDVQVSVPAAGTTTGTVANKNVGAAKPVAVAGLGLSGASAANYTIAATSGVTVNITPKAVTASYTGVDRVYDGTAAATVIGTSAGFYAFDNVGIAGSGVFSAGKNVGTGLAIAVQGAALSGSDAANYSLVNPTGTASASITPRSVTASFSGGSKVYDGLVAAPVSGSVVGMVSGDQLTLSDTAVFTDGKNVGTAKLIAVTGITLGGSDAPNYALVANSASTSGTITPKPLRINGLTGVSAVDRVYDGSTTVAVNVTASGTISPNAADLVAGDVVTVAQTTSGTTTGTMADKNVGSAKPVVVAGLTLAGADAANYVVAAATGVTVNIAPKPVTAVYTGVDKVYDATTAASVTASTGDFIAGDSVSVSAAGSYTGSGAKNVGNAKAVAVSGGTLAGSDAANYTLLDPTGSTTASITPRPLTPSYNGGSKVYDGSTTAPVTATLGGVLGGDVVTFSQTASFSDGKNVGSLKPVQVSGITLGGSDAANYALLADTATTYGSITPRPLSVAGLTGLAAVNRVYDGTLAVTVVASGIGGTATLTNQVPGDDVSVQLPGSGFTSGVMTDKNVGSNKAVALTGLALSGADAANYQITGTAGVTVSITPRPVTAVYTGVDKVYDGSASATVTATSADIIGSDSVTLGGAGVFTGSGAKNVGSGKAIAVTAGAISGSDAANYTLLDPTGSATASITPRPLTASYVGGSKVYDGTLTAPVTAATGGVLGSDNVSFSQTAQFGDSRNVGNAKPVLVSGITLSGSDAANYTLTATTASTTASITPRPLNVTGVTGISAVDRVYDGTTAVSLQASGPLGTVGLDNKLAGDDVTLQLPAAGIGAGVMVDKNAGSNKPVALAGLTLTGADAANYVITGTVGVSVNIAPRPVVLLGLGTVDRVYDGTTQVAINSQASTLSGTIAGDAVSVPTSGLTGTMADKQVGNAKPVTLSGLGLAGADAANYTLTSGSSLSVNIAPRPLLATAVAADRVYDGSTAASVSYSDNRIAGDALTLGGNAAFADKNAGAGKTVNVTGLTLSGADAADYTLAANTASTTATILPKPLQISANAQTKVYGDVVTFSGSEFTANGLVTGETLGQVALSSTGAAAAAGVAGSPYAITAGSASGGTFSPANYSISYAAGTLTVTPRPLTVASNTVVRYSDAPNPTSFDFSISGGGLVNGDNIASVIQAVPAGSANAPGGSIYQLLPTGAVFSTGSAANYDLHYVAGLLIVLPKPARLTDTDTGVGTGGGNVSFVVQVDPAEKQRAQDELNSVGATLAQAPPRLASADAPAPAPRGIDGLAAEIAAALSADSSRITLPALQRLPLITLDPQLRRLIQGSEPARNGTAAP